jgi:hypothetical protein
VPTRGSRPWSAEATTRTRPRVGTADRDRLERLEPATGQGISRAFGRDLHGHGYREAESRCVTRTLGPGLPDPKGTVNGDADVREIANPERVVRVQSAGLQTGESVLWGTVTVSRR